MKGEEAEEYIKNPPAFYKTELMAKDEEIKRLKSYTRRVINAMRSCLFVSMNKDHIYMESDIKADDFYLLVTILDSDKDMPDTIPCDVCGKIADVQIGDSNYCQEHAEGVNNGNHT